MHVVSETSYKYLREVLLRKGFESKEWNKVLELVLLPNFCKRFEIPFFNREIFVRRPVEVGKKKELD